MIPEHHPAVPELRPIHAIAAINALGYNDYLYVATAEPEVALLK